MKSPKELPKAPNHGEPEPQYEFGPFRLDARKRRLWRNGDLVALTLKALDTLLVLVSQAGQLVEKDELMQLVWPDSYVVEDNLTQNISALRKALGDSSGIPAYIATVPRRGYRFVARVKKAPDADGGELVQAPMSSEPGPADGKQDAGLPTGLEHSLSAGLPAVQEMPFEGLRRARTNRERLWMGTSILFFALFVITLGFTVSSVRRPRMPAQPVRFAVYPPQDTSLSSGAVLSPDGRRLAFAAHHPSGQTLLMVRGLDSLEAQALPGTEGATNPFWSPDSQSIAFFAQGKLRRIGLSGEAPKSLADVGAENLGGTWSRDGIILFAPTGGDGLHRVSADGGVPTSVTKVDLAAGETRHHSPSFLPDGRHFFYVSGGSQPQHSNGIHIGSVDSAEWTRLLDASYSSPAYAPSGHLLFLREEVLLAQAFDTKQLKLSGEPIPLVEGISSFAVSDNGTLAYSPAGRTHLVWFDRAGRQLEVVPDSNGLGNTALSPDDTQIAANRRFWGKQGQTIWFVDAKRGSATRFTPESTPQAQPVWSPDGKHIVFTSGGDLYRARADGATQTERLLTTPAPKFPCDWSLDGRYIAYITIDPKTKHDL